MRLTYGYIDGRKIELSYERGGKFKFKQKNYKGTVVYLRLLKKGNKCPGYVSADGKNFVLIGEYTFNTTKISGIGLIAFNGDGSYDSTRAAFDYVRILY